MHLPFNLPMIGATAAAATTTLNPSDKSTQITLSNGNLTFTLGTPSANGDAVRGTTSKSTGKVYFEVTTVSNTSLSFGIGNATSSPTDYYALGDLDAWLIEPGDTRIIFVINNGTTQSDVTSSGGTAAGVVYNVAIDIGAKKVWVGRNGTYPTISTVAQNPAAGTGGFSFSGINAGPYFPLGWGINSGDAGTFNFGATAFNTAPPSGFSAWG